jgi:hypothetical protein
MGPKNERGNGKVDVVIENIFEGGTACKPYLVPVVAVGCASHYFHQRRTSILLFFVRQYHLAPAGTPRPCPALAIWVVSVSGGNRE